MGARPMTNSHQRSPAEGIYRRVTVRIYGDEKFMRLSPLLPSGQALWLYLLTGPHTGPIPGVFVAGRAAITEALDWEAEAFAEVIGEGLVEFDAKTRMWFIPKAIHHNTPPNPNVVKSWRSPWLLLPECELRDRIGQHLLSALSEVSEAFGKAFIEASRKALDKPSGKPSPKHMAKQEAGDRKQEQERQRQEPFAPTKVATDPEGFAEFWSLWPTTSRKQDRKKCAEKWRRNKLATALPKILAHVTAMKGTKTWREGFEPAPLTYLTGERWNDGMPPVEQARSPLHADDVFEAAR